MNNSEILQNILNIMENSKNQDGWTELALIGQHLSSLGVDYQTLGYSKLQELIEDFPENIEIKKDLKYMLPVIYVKPKTTPVQTNLKLKLHPENISFNLRQWAFMGDFRQVISDLANIALNERWHFKNPNIAYPHPILSKYLIYTFFRLVKEKGKINSNEQFAVFNTGLVDNSYEPIYALFEKNKVPGKQEWYFREFCISGVGKSGKILVSNFYPLPERAKYFRNPAELFYDIYTTEPQLNWNHIILDNVSRIPSEILEENKPSGLIFRDTNLMNELEKYHYYHTLADAIENDQKKFRAIKNRFADSFYLALKRVHWNFKTAIPMYYPTLNRLSLLLPLSLIHDEIVDLALVVEKMPSGCYFGHTILPLSWAYNSARLINRPDSDWLIAENIESDTVKETDEEDVSQ
jgi:hypothetical protein